MLFFKNLLYQTFLFNFMIIINKLLIFYFDITIINSFLSIISIWIISDSFVINNDLNNLQYKYSDLHSKYTDLLKDFNNHIKDKYNQINLICDTLSQHTIVIADCRNEIINLKNKIILLKPYYKSSRSNSSSSSSSSSSSPKNISPILNNSNTPIDNANSFNKFHDLHLKMKGRLHEYLLSKSCIF